MVVKIKCRQCGDKRKFKRVTLRDARAVKRLYKNGLCGRCEFAIMANRVAKEIVRGVIRA